MRKPIELLAGAVYGNLTVQSGGVFGATSLVAARCGCGKVAFPTARKLTSGHVKSCGCMSREYQRAGKIKHGHAYKREHVCWRAMWDRCTRPDSAGWTLYGGRGISVCDRWRSFESFMADMGPRPAGTSIERRDANGNYEPSNCHWATPTEQQRNTRKSRLWCIDGVEYPSQRAAAAALGVGHTTIAAWCAGARPGCSSRPRYASAPSSNSAGGSAVPPDSAAREAEQARAAVSGPSASDFTDAAGLQPEPTGNARIGFSVPASVFALAGFTGGL